MNDIKTYKYPFIYLWSDLSRLYKRRSPKSHL